MSRAGYAAPCFNIRAQYHVEPGAEGIGASVERGMYHQVFGLAAKIEVGHEQVANFFHRFSFSSSALASFKSAVPKPSVNQLSDLREHRARLVAAAGAVEPAARG
jgi:hypothetical protein